MNETTLFAWNPDDFTDALAFYENEHAKLLRDHVLKAYAQNGDKMDVNQTSITHRAVNSQSSVYRETITREFAGPVDNVNELAVNDVLVMVERYLNLCGVCLIWAYDDKVGDLDRLDGFDNNDDRTDEPGATGTITRLMALDASQFSVRVEGFETKALIVRDKVWYDEYNTPGNRWLKYEDNRIYEGFGTSFSADITWEQISVYKEFPFFLVSRNPRRVTAVQSPFVGIEKNAVGNLALNRLSGAIAIMQLIVAKGASDSDVAAIAEMVGNMTGTIGLPNTVADLKTLAMGDTENNERFNTINKDELRSLCVQHGVDYTMIDVDEVEESGVVKEYKVKYLSAIRADNVPFWYATERRLWLWLSMYAPKQFKPLKYADFGTYTVTLSAIEQVQLDAAKHKNSYDRVLTGVKPTEDYVDEFNPEKTDAEKAEINDNVVAKLGSNTSWEPVEEEIIDVEETETTA